MKMKRPRSHKLPPWTKFERGVIPPPDPVQIAEMAHATGYPVEEVQREYEARMREEVWLNSRYQVNVVRQEPNEPGLPVLVHLSIKRLDKQPVGEERFRDFQRIKNELVGPECEAVELYPAESRLVDSANQYHLFVIASDSFRWPFGFGNRLVRDGDVAGARQRPFSD
jgi:hypothetical protein